MGELVWLELGLGFCGGCFGWWKVSEIVHRAWGIGRY